MLRLTLCTLILSTAANSGFAQEPETPQPTEFHKLLEMDAGVWTGEMKMWMAGPDQPPMVMPIKETNTLMDGGFWTVSEFEAGPFKGKGQMGYDPIKKKYVGTWIDSSTPFLSVMEGDFDKDKNQMVMFFEGMDVMTGKMAKMKNVTKHLSKDKREFTMYKKNATSGKWDVSFVINYERSAK